MNRQNTNSPSQIISSPNSDDNARKTALSEFDELCAKLLTASIFAFGILAYIVISYQLDHNSMHMVGFIEAPCLMFSFAFGLIFGVQFIHSAHSFRKKFGHLPHRAVYIISTILAVIFLAPIIFLLGALVVCIFMIIIRLIFGF